MNRDGYTLPEVLLAAFLLGLIAVGIGRVLATATETTRLTHDKVVATRIGTSEVERIRAMGPLAVGTDTVVVSSTGEEDPGGEYRVEVTRTVECDGGTEPADNSLEAERIAHDCIGTRPSVAYGVVVWYPYNGQPFGAYLSYGISLTEHSVHSDTLVIR